MRFSIGEFSRISSLSIKSLRLYHERGILVPAQVDPASGYRYYDEVNFETAKSIQALKGFGFSLGEIKELIDACDDEAAMLPQLEAKLHETQDRIERYREISGSLRNIIEFEKESAMNDERGFAIEERDIETILIAGHRMTGRYEEVGTGLKLVCKSMGRHCNGKPMTLYHDAEYKEEDADFEPCVPVRKGKDAEGISVRELRGGRCISLMHRGPYETLRESYKRVFAYVNEHGYSTQLPFREIYHKGPGMIFRGNPNNYLTEIQVLITGEGRS